MSERTKRIAETGRLMEMVNPPLTVQDVAFAVGISPAQCQCYFTGEWVRVPSETVDKIEGYVREFPKA